MSNKIENEIIYDFSFLDKYKEILKTNPYARLSDYIITANQIVADPNQVYSKNLYLSQLITEILKRRITFIDFLDLTSAKKHFNEYIKFNIFYLTDIYLFDINKHMTNGRIDFLQRGANDPNVNYPFIHYLTTSEFKILKPNITANIKVIKYKTNVDRLVVLNNDILKLIPLKKIKNNIRLKSLLYVYDNVTWKNLLFTKYEYVSTRTFFRVLVLLNCNSEDILTHKEFEQISYDFIKRHWNDNFFIKTPHEMCIFSNEVLSESLLKSIGKDRLHTLIQRVRLYKPNTYGLLRLGAPIYKGIGLTNLSLFKSSHVASGILSYYPELLSTLKKEDSKHLNYWFFRYRSWNLKNETNKEKRIEITKNLVRLIEGRRFEKKFFTEFPKLKMFLLD